MVRVRAERSERCVPRQNSIKCWQRSRPFRRIRRYIGWRHRPTENRPFFKVNRLVVQQRLVLVKVLDELGDAAAVVELVRALGLLPLVLDGDADALVEERLFAQALGEFVEAELADLEDFGVGLEGDFGAAAAGLTVIAICSQNPSEVPCRRSRPSRFPAGASREEIYAETHTQGRPPDTM